MKRFVRSVPTPNFVLFEINDNPIYDEKTVCHDGRCGSAVPCLLQQRRDAPETSAHPWAKSYRFAPYTTGTLTYNDYTNENAVIGGAGYVNYVYANGDQDYGGSYGCMFRGMFGVILPQVLQSVTLERGRGHPCRLQSRLRDPLRDHVGVSGSDGRGGRSARSRYRRGEVAREDGRAGRARRTPRRDARSSRRSSPHRSVPTPMPRR